MEVICNFLSRRNCPERYTVPNPDWAPVCRGRGCKKVIEFCLTQATQAGPCPHITEGFCRIFINPEAKWRTDSTGKVIRRCNMAEQILKREEKKKLNPLKASKRAKKGAD